MFSESDTLDHVAPSGPSPAAVPRAKSNLTQRRKTGGARVIEKEKENEDWVACIARVRDVQDQDAFARLFRHFAPRVKAFLIRSGADAAMAEECAQDVMATLWKKSHLFDPARASAATWIFTIARNRRIDAIRKQRRPEPEELTWGPDHEPDQADALALQQESEHLSVAIAALPDKQRELIEKAYFSDLSHREIADETGLPLGTIKSRIRLALDRLRHTMK
ncbi:sigma-70 family RNA polymerase sigma factor [Roseovarius sp. 2305UL8-3]|uniref:sigma-70 family RNA polymerase sigma factor n=1 Tax=Roseovarius conchicola TaxID=3121636 RepID=UPI003528D534